MANKMYGKGRQALGAAQINWETDDFRALLIDTALYTVDIDVDEFLDDVPAGARVGSAVALTGKANVLGVLDCADFGYTGLVSAPSIEALVIYKHTGTESTSRLFLYVDTATGLPVSSGSTAVNITVDSGTNKLVKL